MVSDGQDRFIQALIERLNKAIPVLPEQTHGPRSWGSDARRGMPCDTVDDEC